MEKKSLKNLALEAFEQKEQEKKDLAHKLWLKEQKDMKERQDKLNKAAAVWAKPIVDNLFGEFDWEFLDAKDTSVFAQQVGEKNNPTRLEVFRDGRVRVAGDSLWVKSLVELGGRLKRLKEKEEQEMRDAYRD